MTRLGYAVIRPADDLPPGFLSPVWDGRWIKLPVPTYLAWLRGDYPIAKAYPTSRYETRSDGAVAEVYEVRTT